MSEPIHPLLLCLVHHLDGDGMFFVMLVERSHSRTPTIIVNIVLIKKLRFLIEQKVLFCLLPLKVLSVG